MKRWIFAVTIVLIIHQGMDAREHWGPPPLCPRPKVDCCKPRCPKKKCCPAKIPKKLDQKEVCEKKETSCKKKEEVCEKKPPPCKPKPCCKCPSVCFERGYPTKDCCVPPAYNEPAAFQIDCGYNVFLSVDFIFWQGIQGGMDLAVPGQANEVDPITNATMSAVGKDVLISDFEFKPGFQLGLGWSGGCDDWELFAEYTWMHASTNTSQTAQAPGVSSVENVAVAQFGVWIPTAWLSPGVHTNAFATYLSSRWEYDVDILDFQVSRPFYSGKNVIFDPFLGLRALWFSQKLDISATNFDSTPSAKYCSKSWGLGPRVGVDGKWLFGCGLRMIGDVGASLLFTRYTSVTQDVGSFVAGDLPVSTSLDDFNTLRPNLDLSLGFGWGSYFCCRRFHWDLAASYDFNIFWEQNMMRYLADLTTNSQVLADGAVSNFYLHGLTLKVEFEF